MRKRKEPGFTLRLPGGPIDWKAWHAEMAEQARPKGLTPEQRARQIASRKANAERRRRETAEREQELLRLKLAAPAEPRKSLTNEEMLLGTMEPDTWYSVRDMHEASGVRYDSCKAYGPKLFREGWFERMQNPDWRPPVRVGAPQLPKWLYRLSWKARERARQARALR